MLCIPSRKSLQTHSLNFLFCLLFGPYLSILSHARATPIDRHVDIRARGPWQRCSCILRTHCAHAIVWIPMAEPKNSHSVIWQNFFAFRQFAIYLKHMRQVTSRLVSSVLLVYHARMCMLRISTAKANTPRKHVTAMMHTIRMLEYPHTSSRYEEIQLFRVRQFAIYLEHMRQVTSRLVSSVVLVYHAGMCMLRICTAKANTHYENMSRP